MKTLPTALAAVVLLIAARVLVDPFPRARADDVKPESARAAEGNDAKAGQTKTDEANTLLARGKAEAREAQLPENETQKDELRNQAHEDFAAARELSRAEHDRFKSAYDKYDKFIPKSDKATYDARELVFRQYIQSQLQLAMLGYEEAQSWDKGSPENKQLLTDAAEAFEKIHSRYRQMVAGLYARMWQGKCFEEQNDIVKALGLYNELLGHGGGKSSPPLADLQDRVRHFRLICLNRAERKDYQLAMREAEEWLDRNQEKTSTPTGLGIQWELARALEFQAGNVKTDAARTRLLERALSVATAISREPGDFKDASSAMVERLDAAINGKPNGSK